MSESSGWSAPAGAGYLDLVRRGLHTTLQKRKPLRLAQLHQPKIGQPQRSYVPQELYLFDEAVNHLLQLKLLAEVDHYRRHGIQNQAVSFTTKVS